MKLTAIPLSPLRLFSIVIPSWNNLVFLKLCVGSVRAHSAFEHQIIVHVNDGSDGTLHWVRSQGLAYTHSAENAGICLTVNQAAALAQHELIVYLNDDMYCANVHDFGSDAQTFDEQRLLTTYQTLVKPDWYGATWPPTLVACGGWLQFGVQPRHEQ